jgi:hypothetical protein
VDAVLQDVWALLHKYLKLLRGKDCQSKALIDQTLYNKAFRRKAESLCNNATLLPTTVSPSGSCPLFVQPFKIEGYFKFLQAPFPPEMGEAGISNR